MDPGVYYVESAKPDREEHLAFRQRWPHLHQVLFVVLLCSISIFKLQDLKEKLCSRSFTVFAKYSYNFFF